MTSKRMILLSLIVGAAALAAANPLPVCGWEECDETVFWVEGPGIEPIIATRVTAPEPVVEGDYSLKLVQNAPDAAPLALLAYLDSYSDNVQIHFEIAWYKSEPESGPNRILARYLPDDLDAGGPETPTGTGWQWISHNWQMIPGQSGLAIYVEMPGDAGDTIWLDHMVVIPTGAGTIRVTMPCSHSVVPAEGSTLSAVKDLYR
jgi:hypothetical protein